MISPTFQSAIIKKLASFGEKSTNTENPDGKHNTGRLLGLAFMWDVISDYAKKQSDLCWDKLEREGIIECPSTKGDYKLAESPHFMAMGNVSEPVRRFNEAALIDDLHKRFQIGKPILKEAIQNAKKPTNPVKRMKIVER